MAGRPSPARGSPGPQTTPPVAAGAPARGRRGGRARAARQAGLPGGVVALLVLGAAVAVLAGLVLLFRSDPPDAVAADTGTAATLRVARQQMEVGDYDQAEARLGLLGAGELGPEQAAALAALRTEIAAARENRERLAWNVEGSKYLEARLQSYEASWLAGSPDSAKVRVFLKRCRTFRAQWPDHAGLDWVDRQERRFAGAVDVDAPPTLADVEWEVETLTGGLPKEYGNALTLVNAFLSSAAGADLTRAQALEAELLVERAAYHLDRLQQARYEYDEKDDPGEAVRVLVEDLVFVGDRALEDEAAGYLVKIPDVDAHLRGYARYQPERYARLLENGIVRGYAERKGLPGTESTE